MGLTGRNCGKENLKITVGGTEYVELPVVTLLPQRHLNAAYYEYGIIGTKDTRSESSVSEFIFSYPEK